MGEVINLRRARKEREKREREAKARENRAAFGRAESERDLSEAAAKLERSRHEAHRLDRDDAPDGDDVA